MLVFSTTITECLGWAKTIMKTPGYVPGNLMSPRRKVLMASTATGLVPVLAGLRPTFISEGDIYPGWLQGLWPMWQITAPWLRKVKVYRWSFDVGMSNLQVSGHSVIMLIGPVMAAGQPSDFYFPGPPPGLLKIPVLSFPVTWSADQIRTRLRTAIRAVMASRGRVNGRTILRIAFKDLTILDPLSQVLVVADSEFTRFVSEVKDFLGRMYFPEDALEHTNGTVTSEEQHVLTLLPTVHAI